MNWPKPFLDAGFTDREIVPGKPWKWELCGTCWMRLEFTDAYPDWFRIEVSEEMESSKQSHMRFIEMDTRGNEDSCTDTFFPSLPLARKAAEDLVCRLNGVPTEAERGKQLSCPQCHSYLIEFPTQPQEVRGMVLEFDRLKNKHKELGAENAELRATVERLTKVVEQAVDAGFLTIFYDEGVRSADGHIHDFDKYPELAAYLREKENT